MSPGKKLPVRRKSKYVQNGQPILERISVPAEKENIGVNEIQESRPSGDYFLDTSYYFENEDSYNSFEAMLNSIPTQVDKPQIEHGETEQTDDSFEATLLENIEQIQNKPPLEKVKQPINFSEIEDRESVGDGTEPDEGFDDTESDEDYVLENESRELEIDSDEPSHLEPETELNLGEDEFLPEYQSYADRTFDCTEDNPVTNINLGWNTEVQLNVGQEWLTLQDARDYLRLYGVKKKFEIRFQVNLVNKVIARCKHIECPWRCYIRVCNDGHTAICKGLLNEHTCENDGENKNSLANAKWIAKMIQQDMVMHHKSFTPSDIKKLVWHRFSVTIKYWKAWNARAIALENLYGNYEESYMKVPELCRQIQISNPGSLVKWEADKENKFMYMCLAYKNSLDGWRRACRPIVGFDGCFLKGKYGGCCLVAVGMDANNGMYPIATFVCRKEDGYNWDKFLEILGPELKKHPLPLTVISDRAPSLISAIDSYLHGCNQRSCFRHIFKNMTKYWRGGLIQLQAWSTAKAYKVSHFEKNLDELEATAPGAKEYLMNISPTMWSKAHFDSICKSDHLTNNFTKSFNSFILNTRDKPVCAMVIGVSFLQMKIMYDRKRDGNTLDENDFVPRVKKIIQKYKEETNDYITEPSGDGEYCVRKFTGEHWTVNLRMHNCGCGEWQVTGIPCVHVVHLLTINRFNFLQYIVPMLSVRSYRSTYDENIKPIAQETDWPQSDEVLLPPIVSRGAGRPRNNRILGVDERELTEYEKRNLKKCSKCGGFGHNRRSCQGGPVAGVSGTAGAVRGGRGSRGGATRGGKATKRGGRTGATGGKNGRCGVARRDGGMELEEVTGVEKVLMMV